MDSVCAIHTARFSCLQREDNIACTPVLCSTWMRKRKENEKVLKKVLQSLRALLMELVRHLLKTVVAS